MSSNARLACGIVTVLTILAAAACVQTPPVATPPPPVSTTTPPTPTPTPVALSWPDLFDEVRTGVARVAVTTCDGGGSGSGFLVGTDTVMTAAHVVDDATSLSLRFGSEVYRGEVVALDAGTDLALVRVAGVPTGHLFETADTAARVGTPVAALGFPLGQPLGMTQGTVSSVDLRVAVDGEERHGLFRTDTAINPGNSGGPMVDATGAVVGVVDAGSDYAGDGYAIPLDQVGALLDSWVAGGEQAPDPAHCESNGEDPFGESVIVTVSSDAPEAASVAQTFQLYADGINNRYDDQVWSLLTPNMQRWVGGQEAYSEGLATSSWVWLDVEDVEVIDAVTDEAIVSFGTTQDAEHGPDGQTCSHWRVTYRLTLDEGYWQIDSAKLTDGQPAISCEDDVGDI